ncbi:MAG: hypothetical protein J5449_11370, partial [Oscillospiraceae bacterium]|nr:hypothetical protein [Oscillospiraceae bacterium]
AGSRASTIAKVSRTENTREPRFIFNSSVLFAFRQFFTDNHYTVYQQKSKSKPQHIVITAALRPHFVESGFSAFWQRGRRIFSFFPGILSAWTMECDRI